jgi:hypothetical protein
VGWAAGAPAQAATITAPVVMNADRRKSRRDKVERLLSGIFPSF